MALRGYLPPIELHSPFENYSAYFFTFTKIFLFLRIFMESLDFRDDSEREIMILKFSNPATRKGQALIHEM